MSPSTLLVANLAAEHRLLWRRATLCGVRKPDLPMGVRKALAAAGTLMRAVAQENDLLWLEAPLCSERLARIPGLPTVRLVSEAPNSKRLRTRLRETTRVTPWAPEPGFAVSRRCEREAACASNTAAFERATDRGFQLALARKTGLALEGATLVHTVSELADAITTYPTEGAWVLKGTTSAAGRERHIGFGSRLRSLDRRRAERLFAVHRTLLLEPWVDRLADFGVSACVEEDGAVRIVSAHRLHVDGYGRFAALTLPPHGSLFPPAMRRSDTALAARAVAQTGAWLGRLGHRGPFGIDAWRYRDPLGRERFHAFGELNPRMTLGYLSHRLVARLREAGTLPAHCPVTLRIARIDRQPRPPQRIDLLHPHRGDPTAIWLVYGITP